VTAPPAPDRAARPAKKVFARWVVGVILAGCVVGAAAGIALALVFGAYDLPAGSMWPTLVAGDRVFANKLSKEPERGAVVVFRLPENRQVSYVKRIVGMPGDELSLAHGELSINGWKVPRCNVGPAWYRDREAGQQSAKHEGMLAVEYLGAAAYLVFDDASGVDPGAQGPYRVKAGEYFVIGDNRRNSHDSRTWRAAEGGGVPVGDTLGRVRGHDLPELRNDLEGVAGLGPALAACLAKRPGETTPPPPGTTTAR
jgi:signal peptidase I